MSVYQFGVDPESFLVTTDSPCKKSGIIGVVISHGIVKQVLFEKAADSQQIRDAVGFLSYEQSTLEYNSFSLAEPLSSHNGTPLHTFLDGMKNFSMLESPGTSFVSDLQAISDKNLQPDSLLEAIENLGRLDEVLSERQNIPLPHNESTLQGIKRISHVAPRAKLTFDESVIIDGDVGTGAEITVNGGGILIKGAVADNVKITNVIEGSGFVADVLQSVSGFLGGAIMGSQSVENNIEKATLSGVEIEGKVGNDVLLDTTESVLLHQSAGNNLNIDASDMITTQDVGDKPVFVSYNGSIRTGNLGDEPDFHAQSEQITTGNMGKNGDVRAQGSITAGNIGEGTFLESYGGDIKVKILAPRAHIMCDDGNISATRTCKDAILNGNDISIGRDDGANITYSGAVKVGGRQV